MKYAKMKYFRIILLVYSKEVLLEQIATPPTIFELLYISCPRNTVFR